MNIFPAIDIYNGCAVRLYKGDYGKMTVYSDDPGSFAASFEEKGAKFLHMVDLEGARSGETPNLETIRSITSSTGLFTQLGGGIRSLKTIDAYRNIGVDRLILGTAAITQPRFVSEAIKEFGRDAIAVSIDIKGDLVAIKGWTEVTDITCDDFCRRMEDADARLRDRADRGEHAAGAACGDARVHRDDSSLFNRLHAADFDRSAVDDGIVRSEQPAAVRGERVLRNDRAGVGCGVEHHA